MLVLVAGILSCNRQPKTNGVDVVIVDKGVMSFYNAATQKLTPFTSENDSVVNMLFIDDNHLYYTVAKNENLSLKMIDMNATTIEPKLCADWHQTIEDAMDFEFGKVSSLYLDANACHVFIYGNDPEEGLFTPIAYNLTTGKVESLSEEDLFGTSYLYEKPFSSRFLTQDHLFYYVCPERKYCLNDKINVSKYFDDIFEESEFAFGPESFSPDGKKVLFYAIMYWGEGVGLYCVANVDGTSQYVIEDSDIQHGTPVWLSDGSLVYVGEAPLPKDDPDYDEEYNTTQPCVKCIDPQGKTKTVVLGSMIAARPSITAETVNEKQGDLENCDVAILDNGKVTFYNSEKGTFVPYVIEKDSVINGAFDEYDGFCYTVKIGDSLYLKEVYLYNYDSYPVMLAAWGLSINDCVSETYGKAADLFYINEKNRIGIFHEFSWDFYDFSEVKFYDVETQTLMNDWIDEMSEADVDVDDDVAQDEEEAMSEEENPHFVQTDNNFNYVVGDRYICLSDKINFKDYCSDPEYYSAPEFQSISIDPTNRFVAYYAYIEWGDLGHGPLCVASLDGNRQMALKDTDAADVTCGWLKDGSLLYIGQEPRPTDDPEYDPEWNTTKPCVRVVRPDGTDEVFSHSSGFIVKGNE